MFAHSAVACGVRLFVPLKHVTHVTRFLVASPLCWLILSATRSSQGPKIFFKKDGLKAGHVGL